MHPIAPEGEEAASSKRVGDTDEADSRAGSDGTFESGVTGDGRGGGVTAGSSLGREQGRWPVNCISWNMHELWDERRRRVVGRYLREWGATAACIQEIMLTSCEAKDWSLVGRGFLDGFVAVNANGHSEVIVVA